MGVSHTDTLPHFSPRLSLLLSVNSSFPPLAGYFTLMAIVTYQLNMTLPASWPCLSTNSQGHTQGSQCEGCSFPSSLSVSFDFSRLIALTLCSRAFMLSGLNESYFPNTCLSFCCFPHSSESVISSCVLGYRTQEDITFYSMSNLSSNSVILKVCPWTSSITSPAHLSEMPILGPRPDQTNQKL